MFYKASECIGRYVPRGIWPTVAEIAAENAGTRRLGWTEEQWRRWCAAVEKSPGHHDQILAGPIYTTYRIVRELLDEGHPEEINADLKALSDEQAARRKPRPMLPGPKLGAGPRRVRAEG